MYNHVVHLGCHAEGSRWHDPWDYLSPTLPRPLWHYTWACTCLSNYSFQVILFLKNSYLAILLQMGAGWTPAFPFQSCMYLSYNYRFWNWMWKFDLWHSHYWHLGNSRLKLWLSWNGSTLRKSQTSAVSWLIMSNYRCTSAKRCVYMLMSHNYKGW